MKNSLADQAYLVLKQAILHCELQPGLQVAQSTLASHYQLGLTPTREALKRLEQEGYVQSIPRFGYIISLISSQDVRDIYELRLILECAAACLAAARISDAQLQILREGASFTYTFRDRQSYQQFLKMNTRFHARVAAASGNRRLADTISRMLDEMVRIFHLGLELKDSAEEMRQEHLSLVTALEQRDTSLAEQLTRQQILRSQERVLLKLQSRLENGIWLTEPQSASE